MPCWVRKDVPMKMRETSRAVDKKLLVNNIQVASSNKVDGGTLARVMGQLLELLSSEEGEGIFTIMTSNDVSQLPPELTRSGRLDTIWYFGMPNEEERAEIFNIHFGKKADALSDEVINACIEESNNLTGAEIKEMVNVINRRSYMRYAENGVETITVTDIIEAKKEIIPVYKSYKEKIVLLENYVKDRARYSSRKKSKEPKKSKKSLFLDIEDFK